MRVIISDIETEKLHNPEKLWLFGGIDYKTKERFRFDVETDPSCRDEAIKWAEGVDLWVGNNFIPFDEAYESTDWSKYKDMPAFDDSNRGNAYRIYLEMEAATFDR